MSFRFSHGGGPVISYCIGSKTAAFYAQFKVFRMAPKKRKNASEPVQKPKKQAQAKAQHPKAKAKTQSSLSESFHPSKQPKLEPTRNANELSDTEGIFDTVPADAAPAGAASTIQEKAEEKTMDCKEGHAGKQEQGGEDQKPDDSVTGKALPDQPLQDGEGGEDQKPDDSVTGKALPDQPLQDGEGGEEQKPDDPVTGKAIPDQPLHDAGPSEKKSDGEGGEEQQKPDDPVTGKAIPDQPLQDAGPSEKKSDGEGGEEQQKPDDPVTGKAIPDQPLQDAGPSEKKSDGEGGEEQQKPEESVNGKAPPDQPLQDAGPSEKKSNGEGGEDQKPEESVTCKAPPDQPLQDAGPSEKKSNGEGGEDQKPEESVTGRAVQDTIAEAEQPVAGEGHGKRQEAEARESKRKWTVPPKFVLNKAPFTEMTALEIENQPGIESTEIVSLVYILKSVHPKWRDKLMDRKISETTEEVLDKICQEVGSHIMLSEFTEFVNTGFGKPEEEPWAWEPDGESNVEDMKDFVMWLVDRDSESKRKPDSFLNSLDSVLAKISSMDPACHEVKIAQAVSSMCLAELTKVFNEGWGHESLVDHVEQLRTDEDLDDWKFGEYDAAASLQSFIRQLLNNNRKVKKIAESQKSAEESFPALSGPDRLFFISLFISYHVIYHIISLAL